MPNKVEVTSGEEAEDAAYVVCIPVTDPLKFEDNMIGRCVRCNCRVQFRPHAPKTPPRVCWECIQPDVLQEYRDNNLGISITDKSMEDVMGFLEALDRKMKH